MYFVRLNRYPTSIETAESIDCCNGNCKRQVLTNYYPLCYCIMCFVWTCFSVPKIIPGVYHILSNETESPNRMKYIDFIWDSSVWYVSDYNPVFSFEQVVGFGTKTNNSNIIDCDNFKIIHALTIYSQTSKQNPTIYKVDFELRCIFQQNYSCVVRQNWWKNIL